MCVCVNLLQWSWGGEGGINRHKSQASPKQPGHISSWRDARGEAVPPTKAQREGTEEASGAQPEGAEPELGAVRSVRTCRVGCRVGPGGCVFRVLAMGQIEWAMWANEQALASGLSE